MTYHHHAESTGRRAVSRIAVPLIILVFCATAFWLTTTFERVPPILKRGIQPSDFPQLVILLMAGLAVWVLLRDSEPAPGKIPPVVWGTLLLIIVFPLLTIIDLFLGLGITGLGISLLWGERRVWALATVMLIMPLAIFLLFDMAFSIRFPRGVFTSLWYG